MTIQAQVSVHDQAYIARNHEIFARLDVDKHSLAVTLAMAPV